MTQLASVEPWRWPRRIMLLSLSAILCSSLSVPAFAQLASGKNPPPVEMTDRNGVDIKAGQFTHTAKSLGIGAADAPAVSYSPIDINTNSTNGTPLIGWVTTYACPSPNEGDCSSYFTARLGNSIIFFPDPDGQSDTLIAPTGERYVLSLGIIYDKDDTAWYVGGYRTSTASGTPAQQIQTGGLYKIIYRDGRELDYYYNNNLDQFIFSNEGYELVLRSGQSNVKLINLAYDYCAVSSSVCDVGDRWPTFKRQYTSGQDGNYTDPLGYVTAFSTTTVNGGGTDSVINYPTGRWEKISKRSVITYQTAGPFNTTHAEFLVTAYQNNRTSASYGNYTSDVYGGRQTATATYPDGTSISYASTNPSFNGVATLTDELTRSTKYTFSMVSLGTEVPGLVPGYILGIERPEHDISGWAYDTFGNVTAASLTAKPSFSDSLSSSSNFDGACVTAIRCHQPNSTVDARGKQTDYEYDPTTGMLRVVRFPADQNGNRREIHYHFEQRRAVYKQSADGQPTASDKPVFKLISTSECRSKVYPDCVGKTDEIVKSYDYDGNLLVTRETIAEGADGLSATVTREYDEFGNIRWIDGPQAGTDDRSYYFWDAKRQPIGEISANPKNGILPRTATRRTFNAEGMTTLVEHGTASDTTRQALDGMAVHDKLATVYSPFDEKLSDTWMSGDGQKRRKIQYSYDTRGRVSCTAERMNPAAFDNIADTDTNAACMMGLEGTGDQDFGPDRITRNVYDAAGQLIQVRKAVGTSLEQAYTTYSYTPNGKQEYVIDALGSRAKLEYDGFDRQTKWIFPSSASPPSTYNPGLQTTDAATILTNALGSAGSLNTADYEQYTYDANGNRTSLRKRDGATLNYCYDALNRMSRKTVLACSSAPGSDTAAVYYGYDLPGHQTYARFGSEGGAGVTNTWDGLGRQMSSTLSMDGYSSKVQYCYDADGNRLTMSFPDGATFSDGQAFDSNCLTAANNVNYVSYSYDGLDRLQNIKRPGGSVVASYKYNSVGQRSEMNGGVNTAYSYDGIGRVNAISNTLPNNAFYNYDYRGGCPDTAGQAAMTMCYNPASQITSLRKTNNQFVFSGTYNVSRSYQVNGLNQYKTAGAATFSYDANGNLKSDGATTFTYDIENRLITAIGAHTANLRYDPLGRLYETSGGSSGTTRFVYDGDALIGEYDGGGNLLRRYVHGADGTADDPVAWYEGTAFGDGNERILRQDWQGSFALVTDHTGSNVFGVNTYDEYGIPGTNNIGRFQYTGQAWQPDLGMYYYKARFYSPTLGRFLQTDPVGYKDQVNLYAYVANDPVNSTDPSGECAIVCGAVIGAVVDGGIEAGTQIWNNGKVSDWGAVGRHTLTGAAIGAATGGIGNLIRAGGTVIKIGDALLSAGSAGSTKLAQAEVMKAAQATLSGLAKGEGRVFAGSGSKATLREAGNLAKKYGGEAGDYQKVSSKVIAEGSNGAKVEVHAYRNVETGRIFEPKIKVQGGQ